MAGWKKNVLQEIRPDEREIKEVEDTESKLLEICEDVIDNFNAKDVVSVGSIAKDTWLSGTHDIDLFVRFSSEISKDELEGKGLEIGKEVMKEIDGDWHVEYAEHPYVRGEINGFDVDIVPCYDVPAHEIKSSVDRTPHHTEYVNSELSKRKRDEVRLLKKFCHAHRVYGAKLSVEGFSGYLCELLIIKFGTFNKLMKEVSSWTPGIEIQLEDENEYEPQEKEPLIFIDPVDPNRNVASVLNLENFIKFVSAAQNFVDDKTIEHFSPKKYDPITKREFKSKIKERSTKSMVLEFEKPDVINDVLYPQLRKLEGRIVDILEEYEFSVLRSDFEVSDDNVYLLLEMKTWRLPNVMKKKGPSAYSKKRTKEFLNKYDDPIARYVEDDKWVVEIEREWKMAGKKLADSLNCSEDILKEKGIPSYLAESISEEFRILEGKKITKLLKDEEFARFLSEYFNKNI